MPAGAEIFRISDGQILGKTPWHGEQEQSDQEIPVRLSLVGYQDRIVQLKSQRDDHKEVTLDPLPVDNTKPVQPPKWKPRLPIFRPPTKTATHPNARPKIVD